VFLVAEWYILMGNGKDRKCGFVAVIYDSSMEFVEFA
jgi:hypothetical protein